MNPAVLAALTNPHLLAAILPTILSAFNVGGKDEEKSSTYTDEQQDLLKQAIGQGPQDITQNQSYGNGMDWLNDLFNDPDFFNKFEAPLQRQFQEETIPGLTNRFAAMGTGGALGSTGFRNQLAREGERLHENIGALRGGLQQQGVNQGLQYAQQPISNYNQWLNSVLSPQPNNVYQPASNPWAPVAGAAWQSYAQQPQQQQPMQNTPGISPLTQ